MLASLEMSSSSSPPLSLPGVLDQVESISSSPATSVLSTPSPRPRGTAADFIKVDWTLWDRHEWAKWPGFARYTGGQGTRAWWQEYGYRVEDHSTSRPGNRLKWICADCFARGFKKKSDFCFICSRSFYQEASSRCPRYPGKPLDTAWTTIRTGC
jgi:hypothetical protein